MIPRLSEREVIQLARQGTPKKGWELEAACKSHDDDIFFNEERYTEAKAICSGCEVRSDCLLYGITTSSHGGVWGGHTPEERTGIRKRINQVKMRLGVAV